MENPIIQHAIKLLCKLSIQIQFIARRDSWSSDRQNRCLIRSNITISSKYYHEVLNKLVPIRYKLYQKIFNLLHIDDIVILNALYFNYKLKFQRNVKLPNNNDFVPFIYHFVDHNNKLIIDIISEKYIRQYGNTTNDKFLNIVLLRECFARINNYRYIKVDKQSLNKIFSVSDLAYNFRREFDSNIKSKPHYFVMAEYNREHNVDDTADNCLLLQNYKKYYKMKNRTKKEEELLGKAVMWINSLKSDDILNNPYDE